MTITIEHRTAYTFAAPVFLEPHLVRLRPRSDGAVRLLDFALEIEPPPAVRAENLDLDGNVVTHAWFEGLTTELRLCARARVETLRADPFRFLPAESERSLPYAYAPDRAAGLQQYRSPPDAAHPDVRALALAAARDAERDHVLFPLELARRVHRECAVQARPEGPPRPPETTLAARRGACRDLAVLFVECCRAMGLAARFVSGYAYTDDTTRAELHAWGEVYLSGGGWRGYDPSRGLAVSDQHVTLAAAADSAYAAPVSGSFRGDGVKSHLETELTMRAAPKPSPPKPDGD